jgi:N-acylneuraminate cytidylyltransferase
MKKPIVIIPARGGSKRIPRKNVKMFAGKPIIGYPIKELLDSKHFDSVYVSTDDPEIAQIAESFGAIVPGLRPSALANDYVTTVEVIGDEIVRFKLDKDPELIVCCVYPTAPLLKGEEVLEASKLLSSKNWDYIISSKKVQTLPQRSFFLDDNQRIKLHFPEHENSRTQDLDISYEDAGQFYCSKAKTWISKTPMFTSHSTLYEISSQMTQDIDTIDDWSKAEHFYKSNHKDLS